MTLCSHRSDRSREHSHVSLDHDTSYVPDAKLYKVSGAYCIHYRKSASGNVHILMCYYREITVAEAFEIRFRMLDDEARWVSDWVRWKETNDSRYAEGILFDLKDGLTVGEWVDIHE